MASLTQTRCFNHGQREAVARCPGCRRHYCRECVTEHGHRLLCASCLAADVAEPAARSARSIPFRGIAQLGASVFVLWLFFYVVGQALLLIPSEFHQTFDNPPEEVNAQDANDPASPAGTPDESVAEDGAV